MNCKLEELKALMPNAIRDVDYFNHIVIHQNDEIIRLLKKIAQEEDETLFVAPLSLDEVPVIDVATLSTEPLANLPTQEVKPKAKRKKAEV